MKYLSLLVTVSLFISGDAHASLHEENVRAISECLIKARDVGSDWARSRGQESIGGIVQWFNDLESSVHPNGLDMQILVILEGTKHDDLLQAVYVDVKGQFAPYHSDVEASLENAQNCKVLAIRDEEAAIEFFSNY